MRLWGPVPFSAAKSIPLSAASFFANGLAKILSPAGKRAQNIVIVLKPARRAHGPEGRAGAAGAAAGAGGGGGGGAAAGAGVGAASSSGACITHQSQQRS